MEEGNDDLREDELRKLSELIRSGWRVIQYPIPSHVSATHNPKVQPHINQNPNTTEGACCRNADNSPHHTDIQAGRRSLATGKLKKRPAKLKKVPPRVDLQLLIEYMPPKQNEIDNIVSQNEIDNIVSQNEIDNIGSQMEEMGTTNVLNSSIGFKPKKQCLIGLSYIDIRISIKFIRFQNILRINHLYISKIDNLHKLQKHNQFRTLSIKTHAKNVNDGAQTAGGTDNNESTEEQVHHIFGSIEDMFGAFFVEQQNDQAKQLSYFMETYHHGHGGEGGVFQLVLLNLPSGLRVYGLKKYVEGQLTRDEEVPSWNMIREHFIAYGLMVASKIMSKCGWVVCIHTLEQSREVQDAANLAGLEPHKTLTLHCNLPIYRQLLEPKERVQVLFISIFKQSSEVNEGFFTRDVIHEEMHKRQWTHKNDKAYRAGAQRSSKLWRYLILAFTQSGDSVADLTANTGTGEFVSLAKQLDRHALALEEEGDQ